MKTTLLALVPFATSSVAFPEPKGHEYHAAGPFDSEYSLLEQPSLNQNTYNVSKGRSPCPGLNALANHGYLPHDGKNLDYEMINRAAQDAYHFEEGFYIDAVNMVFEFNISTTEQPNETFNLFDLARHDRIEVDGSLTRNDIYFGDDVHFDASVFAPVAKDLGLSHHHRADRFVTVDTAAKATKNRLDLAKSVNPEFNASTHQHTTEYGTTALYLLTVWDEEKSASPKSWVQALLGKIAPSNPDAYMKE